jgi:hypothetical protein
MWAGQRKFAIVCFGRRRLSTAPSILEVRAGALGVREAPPFRLSTDQPIRPRALIGSGRMTGFVPLRGECTTMSTLPSPPVARLGRARWSDPRLVGGVLLVAASVVLGAKVVAAADDSRSVWALTRDLAAGSTLSAKDMTVRQVRLDGAVNPYVAATGAAPVGSVLSRDLAAGELLPVGAVSRAGRTPEGLVTVPIGRDRLPLGLAPGQRVDIYVSVPPKDGGSGKRQVLAAGTARVEQVEDGGRYAASAGQGRVVLAVPMERVQALVSSIESGTVDLVRIP